LESRQRYWLVAWGGVALAVITELVQALPIVNRDASVGDVIADLIGLLIGLAVAARVEPLARWFESRLFASNVS
jgi:VanZ family protein